MRSTTHDAIAPRWAGWTAALLGLQYAAGKVVMAGRGELGVPGHPAPPQAYEDFSGDVVLAQLGNAAVGLLTVALARALVQPWGPRVPRLLLAAGAGVALLGNVAGAVVVVTSLTGLREDHDQWGLDSLVLGVAALGAWAVLATAAVRGARAQHRGGCGRRAVGAAIRRARRAVGAAAAQGRRAVSAVPRRGRKAAGAAARPGRRAALLAAAVCVAYGALKLDWALGGELLVRQTPLPAGARQDLLDRESRAVAGHWASVLLAAVGVGLAIATVRASRLPRLLIVGLPAVIGAAMVLRAGWGGLSDMVVLTGAVDGDPGYPAVWDLALWSPLFAVWGTAWITAARGAMARRPARPRSRALAGG